MLILTRKEKEKINIFDEKNDLIMQITVEFTKPSHVGSQIRMMFNADKKYTILRSEVKHRKKTRLN